MVIALVSCVKQKQAAPAPARDLYTSALFQKSRAFAERHADAWFILSAKYGLLRPEQQIAPYEMTLKDMRAEARRGWAARVHVQMQQLDLLRSGVEFLWLAGAAYQQKLAKLLQAYPQHDPLRGLRMGERLQWLSEH